MGTRVGTDDAPLVVVDRLRIGFPRRRMPPLLVVDSASFSVPAGGMLGMVGESGSGKTMLCRSLIGTLGRRGGKVLGGSIRLAGEEIANASEAEWRGIRGREISYVPQSALAGLNPVLKIREQLVEALEVDNKMSRDAAAAQARDLLDAVHIARPEIVLGQYAHELSGGMRQRVMIASALAQKPKLLIADEPTTGLDVIVQHEIMVLLQELRDQMGMAVMLVSHDLALIEDVCDDIVVMHAGFSVEFGGSGELTKGPLHPYTVGLYQSRVDLAVPGDPVQAMGGEVPAVGEWPAGCRFSPRCKLATAECRQGEHPALIMRGAHQSACLHADRVGELV